MIGDILQPTHLLFILVVALLVLGPKRLPEVGRSLGRGLRDFRDAMSGDDRDRPDEMTTRTSTPEIHDEVLTPTSTEAAPVHDEVLTPTSTEAAPVHDEVLTPTRDEVHAPTSADSMLPTHDEAPAPESSEAATPAGKPAERVG